MTVKGLSQTTNNSGDDKFDRTTGHVDDVFALCTETSATKTQGVYLFLNCTDLNDNLIAAVETDPLGGIAIVGELDFDMAHRVDSETKGDLKSSSIPVTVSINCNGGALVVEGHGVMDIKWSALSAGGICPLSGSLKLTGAGTGNSGQTPPSFIVDDGSSISIKNRSGSISSFPIF
jgi:hypothetical protein